MTYRKSNLSKNFIKKFIDLSAGKISSAQIEKFISESEKILNDYYFTETSESNFLRIISNQYDIGFFISDLINYPHHLEILIAITVNSNYLTDILVRNPEYFYWLTQSENLNLKTSEKYFIETVENTTKIFKSFESKVNALRNVKKKEILRIGLNDFYQHENLSYITLQLSQLAKTLSSKLFELCYQQILNKYNLDKVNRKYCLISLGKLGAMELNYSSDIDLICFYDKNQFINKRIYYNEILTETIKLFIENSGKITSNGYLYRVDFRLRPDGRNSPLTNSLAEYIRYYETRSEDWEKQMLIKAGFLCGSKSLYKKFFDFKEKIIFHPLSNRSPVTQIRKLKQSIEERTSDDNIKLSSGGIRDIEFSVQALQLLFGKKHPEIRSANTLSVINSLAKYNLINSDEEKLLTNAYTLYRKIEHYLQLMNDRQTHTIPESGELAEKIAFYLGYNSSLEFREKLNETKNKIVAFYRSIFQTEIDEQYETDMEFKDKTRAKNNLEFLRTGRSILGTKLFDSRTASSFESIYPTLIEYLKKSLDPDLVLENFAKIIRIVPLPKLWYEEFENKKFFELFLKICEYSQKAVNKFFENDFVKDDLLSRTCFSDLNIKTNQNIPLPLFHFRVCVQLLSGDLSALEANAIISTYHLTRICEVISKFNLNNFFEENYFIAGLGSFGSGEMSFSSDVDLIFVVKDLTKFHDAQKLFQSLLNSLKNEIKGTDFDCRLRPEGKSSYLVWDFEEYKKYLNNRARIWEFQALTKCTFIEGNSQLYDQLMEAFIKKVSSTDAQTIKSEILKMRDKLLTSEETGFNIKRSKGGLTEIDFIITLFTLQNIKKLKSIIGKSINEKFNLLSDFLEEKDYKLLLSNYQFLKNIEINIQSIFDVKTAKIPIDLFHLKKLSLYNGFSDEKNFNEKIKSVVLSNTELFNKFFQL